jgi:streptogramin lyase
LRTFGLGNPTGQPHALATDPSGNVWIVESAGNRIDRLTSGGKTATLTTWTLPHPDSDLEGVAWAGKNAVWVTEGAGRLARLDPKSGRFWEYSVGAHVHPHAIALAHGVPVFLGEQSNTAVWAEPQGGNRLRLQSVTMPARQGQPTHLTVMKGGILVSEQSAGAVAWTDGSGHSNRVVAAKVYRLHSHVTRPSAARSGLAVHRYRIVPLPFTAKRRAGAHWAEWQLPNRDGHPYGVRSGKRVWLTEVQGNCVGALRTKDGHLLEYMLPQRGSEPVDLLVRTAATSTRVWMALYGIGRLGVLTVK